MTGEERLFTYKPVRGLRDLAQRLGNQAYTEGETPAKTTRSSGERVPVDAASERVERERNEAAAARESWVEERQQYGHSVITRSETVSAPNDLPETISQSSQTNAASAPEVDMDDLLDALSRSIVEDYRRFYRS